MDDVIFNFDVMCGGDSSSVMCLHSSVHCTLKEWTNEVCHHFCCRENILVGIELHV